jgi:hypothetical protein
MQDSGQRMNTSSACFLRRTPPTSSQTRATSSYRPHRLFALFDMVMVPFPGPRASCPAPNSRVHDQVRKYIDNL